MKFKDAQTSILRRRRAHDRAGRGGRRQSAEDELQPRRRSATRAAAGAARLGGYSSTAEGKVIAASYLDNFNKIVATT